MNNCLFPNLSFKGILDEIRSINGFVANSEISKSVSWSLLESINTAFQLVLQSIATYFSNHRLNVGPGLQGTHYSKFWFCKHHAVYW